MLIVVALVGVIASSSGSNGSSTGGTTGNAAQLETPSDITVEASDCATGECRATVSFSDRSEGESAYDVAFEPQDEGADRETTAGDPVDGSSGTGSARRSIPVDQRYCVEVRAVAGASESDPGSGDCFLISSTGEVVVDPLEPWQLELDQCVAAMPGTVIPADAPQPQTDWFTDAACGFVEGTGRVFFREEPHSGGGLEVCRNQGVTGQITSFVSVNDEGVDVLVCIVHG